MNVKINGLSAELFLRLYTSVGWEPPCIEQINTALENTIATFTACDNDKAVGFYRKHGFEERPCDRDGPGMFKMIR